MDIAKLNDLETEIRDYKTTGRSSKFPMPIRLAEQLIDAARRGCVGQSFRNTIDGVRS